MIETLPAAPAFPPVVKSAVEEAATAFFRGSCGLAHVPEGGVDDGAAGAGIMSTISFLGDPSWAFALAFPEDAAVSIAKTFAGFEIPFDSPDMGDVMGEIANVIAGDISARLAKKGVSAQMSLPTTVRGDNVAVLVPSGASTTRFTFAGPQGTCRFDLFAAPTHPLPGGASPEPPRHAEPPAAKPTRPEPATNEAPVAAPNAASDEALAAWAAAEAEAESQLAEQDAAEAVLRAAGGGPMTSHSVAAGPQRFGSGSGPGYRLQCLTILFACVGWGAAAGLLVEAVRHAPGAATESAPSAHGSDPSAAPPSAVARIDALIHSGRFADGLQECLAAPKDAPGLNEPALALREGLCLEGKGQWVEAANAYRKAEPDPDVIASAVALLGQARCATRDDSFVLARALANRVLLRSGHPRCRGLKVREEVRHLRARIDALVAGGALLPRDATARPLLSASASNCFEWLAASPAGPLPALGRDVIEVHRTLESPGVLQVTAVLSPRPTIAVLRALASTAGWKVQVSDGAAALLNREIGPLEVDHMLLPEFLDVLTERTGATWAVQADALLLTRAERQ